VLPLSVPRWWMDMTRMLIYFWFCSCSSLLQACRSRTIGSRGQEDAQGGWRFEYCDAFIACCLSTIFSITCNLYHYTVGSEHICILHLIHGAFDYQLRLQPLPTYGALEALHKENPLVNSSDGLLCAPYMILTSSIATSGGRLAMYTIVFATCSTSNVASGIMRPSG